MITMENRKNSFKEKPSGKNIDAEACPDEIPLYSEDPYKVQGSKYGKQSEQDEEGGFDEALELAGSWHRYQKWVFFISYLSQTFCGLHNVSAVFLSATPDHWCQVPGGVPDDMQPAVLRNLTIPWTPDEGYSKCEYYEIQDFNQTMTEYHTDNGPKDLYRCSSWEFDQSVFQSTLVSDFSLVCQRLWLKASVQASYMTGLLLGSLIMGQLSDRFGRRTVTVISTVLGVSVGILASFANSFTLFLVLRFFSAFFNAGPMVVTFVLVMEIVKPGARAFTGMMCAFFFGCGITILPGVAYFIRDWRQLQLAISLANAILISYYWLLPESPRWLASQGRTEEALDIIKKMAKTNGRQLPPDYHMMKLISKCYIKEKYSDEDTVEKSGGLLSGVVKICSQQLALVKTPNMRRRCVIGFYIWFVAASAYYGLLFSGGNIKANIFLMIFVSGIVEIPSVFLTIFIMNRIGRRLTMVGLFICTGTCCLLILAVPKEMLYVNFALVSLGKFFDTAVFQQAYIYTSELVPTGVRNVAVGTSSMIARIGCIMSPFVVELLGELHYALPSTLFGVLSLIAASFTLLLPETNNKKLPETIDEVEEMEK